MPVAAAGRATSHTRYQRGQVIPADLVAAGFGRVHHGLLAVVERDRSDRAAIVELIGDGGTIGEANLVEPGEAPRQRLEVLLPSRVEWFDLSSLRRARSADIAHAVLRATAARALLASDAAFRKRTQAVSQQVAHSLVELSWGRRDLGIPLCTCLVRQWDLARIVGSNRSSVNQICRRFQRRSWIDVGNTGIRVIDPQALQAYADRGVRPRNPDREGEVTARLLEARAELIDLVVEALT